MPVLKKHRAKYERKLVKKKIKILVEKGYLIDITPGVRNKPHVYADSGKIEMVSETKAGFTPVIEENDNYEVSPTRTPTLEVVFLPGTPTD
ncbi:MAG: hypothetical protein NTZ74_04690 [Chloroflexi bacterium]|nr:hypothetical protein [Chloroflexota bacterium]